MQAASLLSAQELTMDPDDVFSIVGKLGEGSYGSVHKGDHKRTGQIVAIKRIPVENDLEDSLKEISDNYLWIVMEYCAAGSVSDIMNLCHKTLDEGQIAVRRIARFGNYRAGPGVTSLELIRVYLECAGNRDDAMGSSSSDTYQPDFIAQSTSVDDLRELLGELEANMEWEIQATRLRYEIRKAPILDAIVAKGGRWPSKEGAVDRKGGGSKEG
ncbi:Serine/threonine-protein kinase 4 [Irineochytrium annulatum]|nr:Serine/threonine-protein kinase 4 [Irineochytrium annulatum]